jgi:phenylacetate-CoA ligase
MPGMTWPALPEAVGLMMLGFQYQFERTQWWPPERLRAHQFRQLETLLAHAAREVPFYRERLLAAGFRAGAPLSEEQWRRIPILTRAEVQRNSLELRAARYPNFHGKTSEQVTSGSTGQPTAVLRTELTSLVWEALTLRDNLWHQRDMAGTFAALRIRGSAGENAPEGARAPVWSAGAGAAFETGPSMVLRGVRPIAEQIAWLARAQPDYILIHPSILKAMLRDPAGRALKLERLKAVITYSEVVPPDLRELLSETWCVPLQDIYTCEEVGYLALQCPDAPHYHVQSEAVLLEVLDKGCAPCAPGTFGDVVVTSLHNFAMPLIRYAIGDFAEPGPPCACGRGLPVLKRIVGRYRNMIRLRSGDWAKLDFVPIERADLPIIQHQLVQRSASLIEARLVCSRRLVPAEEDRLRHIVEQCGAKGFEVEITYHDEISRSAGGKYEEFMCALDDSPEAPAAHAR